LEYLVKVYSPASVNTLRNIIDDEQNNYRDEDVFVTNCAACRSKDVFIEQVLVKCEKAIDYREDGGKPVYSSAKIGIRDRAFLVIF